VDPDINDHKGHLTHAKPPLDHSVLMTLVDAVIKWWLSRYAGLK
jgi:hypothetical protein